MMGCGGSSTSANDYGVPQWSGPPTDFAGTWTANEIVNQTGAVVEGGGAVIEVLPGFQTASKLTIWGFGVAATNADPCLAAVGSGRNVAATLTPDGHGFDYTPYGGAPLAVHARVDSAGEMHVQADTTGWAYQSPSGGVGGTCSETFSFVASKSADGGT